MSLEHHEEAVPEEVIRRIEDEMHHAQEERNAGHEREAQELLWKALSSASDLKDSKIATKICELLTGKETIH